MRKPVLIMIAVFVLSMPVTSTSENEYVSRENAVERMLGLYAECGINWQNADSGKYVPLTASAIASIAGKHRTAA